MLNRTQLDTLSGKDLDRAIYIASQYFIYISNRCGIAEGYKNYIEDLYVDKLDEEASKIDIKAHKTLKERESIALQNNQDLKALRAKLETAKLRYSKIKLLPEAAREMLHTFKKIMERRLKSNESR